MNYGNDSKSYPQQPYPQQPYPQQPYQQQPYLQQPYPQQPYPQQPYPQKPNEQHGSAEPLNNVQPGLVNPVSNGPKYKDVWAAILFLVDFIIFVVLSGIGINDLIHNDGINNNNNHDTKNNSNNNPNLPPNTFSHLAIIAAGSCVFAGVLTALWLALMRKFPQSIIHFTFIVSIALWFAIAIAFFYVASYVVGIFALLIGGLNILLYFWWRHRIPFSALILETIVDVGSKYPTSYLLTFLSIVITTLYHVWWIVTVAGVSSHFQNSGAVYLLVLFLVFSFYWTTQILRNTLFVTISGTVGTWYFLFGTAGMPQNPTIAAASRAFSTSFGSIAFGSLLVALVQLMRYLVHSLARDHPILACIIDCLLACFQSLLEYFNDYAYIHVALYGKSFIEAGKDVMTLLKSSGVLTIVNDMLIGPVIGIGSGIVGGLSATFAGLWGYIQFKSDWDTVGGLVIALAVLIFFVGLMMMSIVGMFIQAGSSTLFVCIAEQPSALRRTKPELYERVRQLYPQVAWQS